MCSHLDFGNEEHRKLARRIKKGRISLFLGSGFSKGQ